MSCNLKYARFPLGKFGTPVIVPAKLGVSNGNVADECSPPRAGRSHWYVNLGRPRRWLAQAYMASAEFRALDIGGTQRARRLILERTFEVPIHKDAKELFDNCPLHLFTHKAVKILRDRMADTPDAANARVQAIRVVFKWAQDNEVGGVTTNPAREVRRLPSKRSDGIPTWSQEEVEKFHTCHPRGTKARVAFDLLRYTGARRSDVIRFGRQHVKDGVLSYQPFKGRKKKSPVPVDLPILPELRATLDAGPVGDLLFLVSHYGKPFSANGFSRWFRKQCRAAGIEDRSPHGLRKAAAVAAAENGATPHQLGSMLGWKTLAQPERYTKAASRKRLARGAAHLLASPDGEQESLTSGVRASTVREKDDKK
jgi:integrase